MEKKNGLQPTQSLFTYATKRILRMPLAIFGIVIIVIVVLAAALAPWISPHEPNIQYPGEYLLPPSGTFPLGTDSLGRDVLSRIIFGARISLIVSIGAIGFSIAVGTPLGLFSAYLGGWVDAVIMRIMDAVYTFPTLIIAIALIAVMGTSLINVIIAIGIGNIPVIARIVRSQALSVKQRDYVKAAQSIGASNTRVINRHIWPNCVAPVIVQGTLGMAFAILVEASLGFLGLSVPPPTPTWGNMLQYAYSFMTRDPLLAIWPGTAIFVLVLAFNFVGDALRDVLDPRLRGSLL